MEIGAKWAWINDLAIELPATYRREITIASAISQFSHIQQSNEPLRLGGGGMDVDKVRSSFAMEAQNGGRLAQGPKKRLKCGGECRKQPPKVAVFRHLGNSIHAVNWTISGED